MCVCVCVRTDFPITVKVSGTLSITDITFNSDISDCPDISNHLQVTTKAHI